MPIYILNRFNTTLCLQPAERRRVGVLCGEYSSWQEEPNDQEGLSHSHRVVHLDICHLPRDFSTFLSSQATSVAREHLVDNKISREHLAKDGLGSLNKRRPGKEIA